MADELFSSTGREKTYEEIEEGPEGGYFILGLRNSTCVDHYRQLWLLKPDKSGLSC